VLLIYGNDYDDVVVVVAAAAVVVRLSISQLIRN